MPTSWYHVIPEILNIIQHEKPKSILDIGIGFGKYGLLIRDVLEIPFKRYAKNQWIYKIDGVEAFENYRNPIHDYIYNKIYYDDIMNIINNLPSYDVILLIDVLEHFTKKEGYDLIEKLLKHVNKSVIISTPLYPDKQEDYNGNFYEQHKSRWFITDFVKFDFSYKYIPIGNNAAQLYNIFKNNINHKHKPKPNKNIDIKIDRLNKTNLTIGYLLPHKNLTGGMKMLLENMKNMKRLGHKIYAYLKGISQQEVLPDWYDIEVDKKVIIPPDKSFKLYINECDIIIAGWISQLKELKNSDIPIIYWEQGNEWLFGDYNDLFSDSTIRNHLKKCFSLPISVVSCSPIISEILSVRYDKDSYVIPNGIDTSFYYPIKKQNKSDINILLVGNPYLRFKGFDVALKGLQSIYDKGYKFNVNWICQVIPHIKGLRFPINYIQMPDQEKLADVYRNSDILVFTSWYEGFGMPPLEAMASGVPVISTRCGGVESFIQPGFNGILVEPGDIDSLTYAIIELIKNKRLRELLAERGRETALKYDINNIIKKWENFLYYIINIHNVNNSGGKYNGL